MFGVDFSILGSGRSVQPAAAPVPKAAPDEAGESGAWSMLVSEIAACRECGLWKGRKNPVPGNGDEHAELMFVGEAPGADEDASGLPFVGKAGQLLDRMIAAMGLTREQVYVTNSVKCRPPENRTPEPPETNACRPFLDRQRALVTPKVIVALGAPAARTLLGREEGITALRGRFFDQGSARVMPTYHPAYLLRNPGKKAEAWGDLKKVMKELGLPGPVAGRPGA